MCIHRKDFEFSYSQWNIRSNDKVISHNKGIPKIEILWKVFNITYIRLFHLNKSPVGHFAHLQIILCLSIFFKLHLLREGSNFLLTFKNCQIMKASKAFKHVGFQWFKIFPFKKINLHPPFDFFLSQKTLFLEIVGHVLDKNNIHHRATCIAHKGYCGLVHLVLSLIYCFLLYARTYYYRLWSCLSFFREGISDLVTCIQYDKR